MGCLTAGDTDTDRLLGKKGKEKGSLSVKAKQQLSQWLYPGLG